MKIYIENQILEYENNREAIDQLFSQIDESISKHSKMLSHMVIDNQEVYNDYYEHFAHNIKSIEKVEVILQTYKEFTNEVLQSTWEYTNRALSKIDELANNFYKNPDKQSWDSLNDFLGGISWIINTFSTIDQDTRLKDIISSYDAWNVYAKSVNTLGEILPDFEVALANQDNVSIADILSYEILPILKEMSDNLVSLLNMEGLANGLN